jgi:tetratricopeptide (TPR) repeat protein
MKKILYLAILPLLTTSCLSLQSRIDRAMHGDNPYEEAPFYARYLNTGSDLDRRISATLEALRQNPRSAALHNDLGALLLEKGFPKDAEVEFRRALAIDDDLFAAWYNLGLTRESRGDETGAMRAFRRTLDHKSGHPMAHFQLGLLLERRGNTDEAIEHYARAFEINDRLLSVQVNPRILDTQLIDQALLRIYERRHSRTSARLQATPSGFSEPPSQTGVSSTPQAAPSTVPKAEEILTPAPDASDTAIYRTPPPDPEQQNKFLQPRSAQAPVAPPPPPADDAKPEPQPDEE